VLKLYVDVMCISYTLKFVLQVIRNCCEYNLVTFQKKKKVVIFLPKIEYFPKKKKKMLKNSFARKGKRGAVQSSARFPYSARQLVRPAPLQRVYDQVLVVPLLLVFFLLLICYTPGHISLDILFTPHETKLALV
jgi:hypothetical protein